MPIEIEKKYLVLKGKLPKIKNGALFIQGYLCLNPLIRFRIINNDVCINIKKIKDGGEVRDEWEFHSKLNKKEIDSLVALSIKKPISKIRYKIKKNKLLWELDVYQGENSGLITVDIELPSKDFKIEFPDWVDSSKEITNDARYFNKNLGDKPYNSF